jgi:hypothetical protein
MKRISPDLDAVYFSLAEWRQRLANFLVRESARRVDAFLTANYESIRRTLEDRATGPRYIVNIPADALLSFFSEGRYKNCYDAPTVAGKRRGPSQTRKRVDQLLGFGDKAKQYYFGAIATGGTGIRFYGQYAMVLKPEEVSDLTALFDRNSYDLVRTPLSDVDNPHRLVRALRGVWRRDLVDLLSLRMLPSFRDLHRLLTAGSISEAILHDEDFVEAHRSGTFTPADLEEVRQAPEDQLIAAQLAEQRAAGAPLPLTALIWRQRRNQVARQLRTKKVPTRVVASSSRSDRWR